MVPRAVFSDVEDETAVHSKKLQDLEKTGEANQAKNENLETSLHWNNLHIVVVPEYTIGKMELFVVKPIHIIFGVEKLCS